MFKWININQYEKKLSLIIERSENYIKNEIALKPTSLNLIRELNCYSAY